MKTEERSIPQALPSPADDPAMIRALEEYRIAQVMGTKLDRSELLARYPEVAREVAACLDALDFLEQAVAELPTAGGAPRGSSPGTGVADVPASSRPLGDFRLIREVGRGGMGVVYEAEQLSLGRRVALKLLPFAAALDSRQLARFKHEAQATANLRHENIVSVYAVGCERGVHYYAMQFIEGRNLATAILGWRQEMWAEDPQPGEGPAAGPSTAAQVQATTRPTTSCAWGSQTFFRHAALLAVQAARALEHAHQFGVIHRDVKPANLLVDLEGHLWVTDFGLAFIQGETQLTTTGDLVGTLRYMSPEQALGKRAGVDQRTDVYSLGATLYELLTLHPAFPGQDRQDLLRRIVHEEPPAPRRLNPAIPAELETIVLKTLAKAPEERYGSAEELADDLARFLDDEPIRARRPTPWQRLTRLARRHQAMAWSAGVATACVLLVAVAALTVSNQLIRGEKGKALEAERTAKQRLVEARMAQARASRYSRQVGQRLTSWQALTEAAGLARELELGPELFLELRNEAIACLALPDLRPVKNWEGAPPGSSAGLGFTADLAYYARGDHKGTISVRSVADDREQASLPGSGRGPADMQFCPRGELLAIRYWSRSGDVSGDVIVWDWRRERQVFRSPSVVPHNAYAFSPDGRHLALGQPNNTVTIHEVKTGKETHRFAIGFSPTYLSFHPDGSSLAIAPAHAGKVQLRDPRTGELLREWPVPAKIWELAWHPDGTLLAGGCDDGQVYVWNRQGNLQARWHGRQQGVRWVAFARGGRLAAGDMLLSSSWDGPVRVWDPWEGRELLGLAGGYARCSHNGFRLVTQSGYRLNLWDIIPAPEYRSLPLPRGDGFGGVQSGDLSPDGRWLAVASDGGVQLWDLVGNKWLARVPLPGTHDVRFHPSGHALITSGRSGMYHWPVHTVGDVICVGPARRLPGWGSPGQIALDREGRILAAAHGGHPGGGQVVDLHALSGKAAHFSHQNAHTVGVSPDGRWLAIGTMHGFGVKVSDLRNQAMDQLLLPDERYSGVSFSPDGRWLVIGTADRFVVFTLEMGRWDEVRTIAREQVGSVPRSSVFTRDGRLLALTMSASAVGLLDTRTWQSVARLQAPDVDLVSLVGLSPDGSQLLQLTQPGGVRVWDLRLLREQLGRLGMDCELPRSPPPPASLPSLRVEVDPGEFDPTTADEAYARGLQHSKTQRWEQAVRWYTRSIELDPSPSAYHQRGHAQERLGRWQRALDDFHQAFERQPEAAHLAVDRARMYLRLGQHEQALADVNRALARQPDWVGFSTRADVHAEQGSWEEAARDLDRAARLAPTQAVVGYKLALVRLARNDPEGYRQACANLFARAERTREANTRYFGVWTAVIAPGAGDARRLVPVAEALVASDPKNPDFATLLGATLYRAGRYEEAVRRLSSAEPALSGNSSFAAKAVYARLFLALACLQLGRRQEAQAWLHKAVEGIDRPDAAHAEPWNRRLTVRLLRREAETLLKPAGASR